MTSDPSSFFRLNEEIAREVARLQADGHLDRLRELVKDAGVELFVSSARASEGLEELVGRVTGEAGWDHEGVLALRSRFTVLNDAGEAREVYMPDHICPDCLNEQGNVIDGCARKCAACGFAW